MPGTSVLTPAGSENQELETVQAALAKTPRLAKLLSYLVDNYFEGTTDHLTEFNIATEVFGRDSATFISSEDAIARVETHRLRKRLKLFYEIEGRQHPVQISIPLGTYVPVFTHQKDKKPSALQPNGLAATLDSAATVEPAAEALGRNSNVAPQIDPSVHPSSTPPSWIFRLPWRHAVGLGIILLLCGLGLYTAIRFLITRSAAQSAAGVALQSSDLGDARAASVMATGHVSGVDIPFRMIAGYSGPPQKDAEGFLWQPDRYYQRGWGVRHSAVFIRGASDPLVFQYGRDGDTDYDIPLRPGTYELHLYFMQPAETALSEDSENRAVFNLTLNGKLLLESFDIVSDAMGRNTADEKVFRDVSPAADGKLHLHLSTVIGTPSLSAVSLFDGTPGKLLPIRLVTQPMPRTEPNGVLWRPDNYFNGGRYLSHILPNKDMAVADVLSTERYGHFTYSLPVDPRDEYTVSLYFVELFFGTPESSGGGVGSRVFRVLCNGNTLLDNFDIFKEAKNFHVVKKTFYHIRPSAQGKLDLTFEPIINYATVSALEVMDESK